MKKIVVAMYDEEGYTRRLADYFCQHQKNLFDVRLFTSEESLRKFLIGQGTELLITGERDWELFRGINHGIHRLILLSDGQCVREDNGQAVLFKYQSAESMLQEVLAIVADDEELKVPLPKKQMKGTEFVGVFAPYGGAGVTSMALQLAQKYSAQTRCLYLNFEVFDGKVLTDDERNNDIICAEECQT